MSDEVEGTEEAPVEPMTVKPEPRRFRVEVRFDWEDRVPVALSLEKAVFLLTEDAAFSLGQQLISAEFE